MQKKFRRDEKEETFVKKKRERDVMRTLARPAAFALLLFPLIRQRRFNKENTFYFFRQTRSLFYL